jgi:hypothetical protein
MKPDKNKGIQDDQYLFFDLTKDEYEQDNLIGKDIQTDLAKMLREKLVAWDEKTPCLDTTDYRSWQSAY